MELIENQDLYGAYYNYCNIWYRCENFYLKFWIINKLHFPFKKFQDKKIEISDANILTFTIKICHEKDMILSKSIRIIIKKKSDASTIIKYKFNLHSEMLYWKNP